MCGISHSDKPYSDTSLVSYNSTLPWHYLHRDSIRFHRLRVQSYKIAHSPHPHCNLICLDYHLCFWLTACRPGSSKTPSMCLINLLKWLTELRETFYLLCYQFIIAGYDLGIVRWKTYMVQGMGKRHGVSIIFLGTPFSPHLLLSNHSKLFEPHPFEFLMEISLYRYDWLVTGHWWPIQPSDHLSFSEVRELRLKVQTLYLRLVLLATSPQP